MTPAPDPNARRAKELFADALDCTAEERDGFLERTCRGDPDLHRELAALLQLYARSERLFAEPEPLWHERAGDRIGLYVLVDKLGEGGFGTVWLAEQTEPVKRSVALKILKPGLDTPQVLARFQAERQALALMDHPGIAKVLDGGATAHGRPYFVMELVRGVPITAYCDAQALPTNARLDLFLQVCQAVQHAHQKGVIHRDLKPSNVLVTVVDGKPLPKVIDFGIAKATAASVGAHTALTELWQMLGTPEYMAPEQAESSAGGLDTRADVYSLGVLLYELLTGTRPFDLQTLLALGYAEMVRTIREVEPPKPSTRVSTLGERVGEVALQRRTDPQALRKRVAGDLDWIVMKALEKERERRYESAAAFAEDVRRHLGEEPVLARPPSRVYRLGKYVRRHRLGVAAGAAVAASLVGGLALAAWGYVDARAAEARAEQARFAAETARAEEREQKEAARAAEIVATEQRELAQTKEREARLAASRAERVTELLLGLFVSADPSEARGKDFTVRELLDQFAAQLRTQLADEPEVEAAVRATLARSYGGLGLVDESERQALAALELWEGIGKRGRDYVEALRWLAYVRRDQSRLEEAEPLLRAGLEAVANDPSLAAADEQVLRTQLAELLGMLGRFHEAEALAREALELARRGRAEDDPDVAMALEELGKLVVHRDQDEAEQLFRSALAKYAALGERHLWTLGPHHELFKIAMQRSRLDEAEEHLRACLEIAAAAYPEEHPTTASLLHELARVRRARGDLAGAEQLFVRAIDMKRRLQGDSIHVAVSLRNLAMVQIDLGRLEDAERAVREARDIDQRLLPAVHPALAEDCIGVGQVLQLRGDPVGAVDAFRQALEICRASLGADAPQTELCEDRLGRALLNQGEFSAAEALWREQLERRRARLGADSPDVLQALLSVAESLICQQRMQDAGACADEAARVLGSSASLSGPQRELALRLIQTLERLGRGADAENWRRRL